MSRTIIEWHNNTNPPISATNLDGIVSDLNACATVLNKYDSMKQITAETVVNYPDTHYKISKTNIDAVSSAINAKGVACSRIFNNIPQEIRAIPEEGAVIQNGYITCKFNPTKPIAIEEGNFKCSVSETWSEETLMRAYASTNNSEAFTETEIVGGVEVTKSYTSITYYEADTAEEPLTRIDSKISESSYEWAVSESTGQPYCTKETHITTPLATQTRFSGCPNTAPLIENGNSEWTLGQGWEYWNYGGYPPVGAEISAVEWLSAVIRTNGAEFTSKTYDITNYKILDGYVVQVRQFGSNTWHTFYPFDNYYHFADGLIQGDYRNILLSCLNTGGMFRYLKTYSNPTT